MKLFPKMELAVKAMALCCENKDDGKTRCGDAEKSPIARSEVFNETWMLRLTLALIHDYDDNKYFRPLPNDADGKKTEALARIRTAVKRRWISEGGLTAAFENEGATWADAIVGNIKLDDSEAKPKRGVAIDIDESSSKSIVVIEAKMNSALASGITHARDYNQAARNIACLAMLTQKDSALAEKSAFIIFAPAKKLEKWNKAPQEMIKNTWETIEKQYKEHGRTLQAEESHMKSAVDHIVKNSMAISWEEVIQSMANDQNESCEILKWFYEQTCNEYGIKPLWNKG